MITNMKKTSLLSMAIFSLPMLSYAQTGIGGFLSNALLLINDTLLPFLFTLAFLFFIVNAVRYFIVEGASEEGQKKAQRLAVWGIAAFVFISILWGMVNLLTNGLGFDDSRAVCPDYFMFFDNGCGSKLPDSF